MKKIKLSRREFLQLTGLGLIGLMINNGLTACSPSVSRSTDVLRVALLHLAPQPGEIARNQRAIEEAVTRAAALGADWIVTPELAVSGYEFTDRIGTAWIAPQPNTWTAQLAQLATRLRVTIFLGTPERDAQTDKLYNSVLIIGNDGTILGRSHKINVVPIHAEAWSSPGETIVPIPVDGIQVGVLICADAYTPNVAAQLKDRGAQILVSSVAWSPGECGPEGVWEDRSRETNLTLVVCNRTGNEPTMSLDDADSVIVQDGKRIMEFHSTQPSILIAELNRQTFAPISAHFDVTPLAKR